MGVNTRTGEPEARHTPMRKRIRFLRLEPRIWRPFHALTLLAASPGFALAAGAADGFDLRLPALAGGRFDFVHTAIPLGLALLVVTLYAATISIFHVRARRMWNEHFEEQNRTIREAQAQVERSSLFLTADRQLLVALPAEERRDGEGLRLHDDH